MHMSFRDALALPGIAAETSLMLTPYGGQPHPGSARMWSFLKWLAMRLAIVRWIVKIFGMLAFLPIAFLMKTIGLPILIILAILALPVLFVLFLFGLPIFLVLLAGGLVMGGLFAALAFGMLALKVAVFVVLPAWLLWRLFAWMFRRGRNPSQDTRPGTSEA